MINLLKIIDSGVYYKEGRNSDLVHRGSFAGYPRDDDELNNSPKADITFDQIDDLISIGYVNESHWDGYTAAYLTYDGKHKLLTDIGWKFDNWIYRSYACCTKAIPRFCVCKVRTQCPDHGERCNGSHD